MPEKNKKDLWDAKLRSGYSERFNLGNRDQQKRSAVKMLQGSGVYNAFKKAYESADITRPEAERRYVQKWGYSSGFSQYYEKKIRQEAMIKNAQDLSQPLFDALFDHFSHGRGSGLLLVPEYGFKIPLDHYDLGMDLDRNCGEGDIDDLRGCPELVSAHVALMPVLDGIAQDPRLRVFMRDLPEIVERQFEGGLDETDWGLLEYRNNYGTRRSTPEGNVFNAYNNGSRFLISLSHHVLGTSLGADLKGLYEELPHVRLSLSQTPDALRLQYMLR